MTNKEFKETLMKEGIEKYTSIALHCAIKDLSVGEVVNWLEEQTIDLRPEFCGDYTAYEIELEKIKFTLIRSDRESRVTLSNTFYIHYDNEWTEMGYNVYDNEFVWMDEIIDPIEFIMVCGKEWQVSGYNIMSEDEAEEFAKYIKNEYLTNVKHPHFIVGYFKDVWCQVSDTSHTSWEKPKHETYIAKC